MNFLNYLLYTIGLEILPLTRFQDLMYIMPNNNYGRNIIIITHTHTHVIHKPPPPPTGGLVPAVVTVTEHCRINLLAGSRDACCPGDCGAVTSERDTDNAAVTVPYKCNVYIQQHFYILIDSYVWCTYNVNIVG